MKLYHSDNIDFYRHEDAFAQNKGINLSLTNAILLKIIRWLDKCSGSKYFFRI